MMVYHRIPGYVTTEQALAELSSAAITPAGTKTAKELLAEESEGENIPSNEIVFLDPGSYVRVQEDNCKNEYCAVLYSLGGSPIKGREVRLMSTKRVWWNATFAGTKQ